MPFEVIQPDPPPMDSEGEIQLSSEMVELADQLVRESASLDARYPALKPEPAIFQRNRLRSRWIRTTMSICLVPIPLAITIAIAVWWPTRSPLSGLESSGQREVTESAVPYEAPDVDSATPLARPAVFLENLSAPELEGLLDLWESEGSSRQSLSM